LQDDIGAKHDQHADDGVLDDLFAAFFDVHNLQNPFKGYMTFLKFPVQLDYILLPRSTKILEKERYRSAYGSDHLPISIKI
jgi:endonuclease/exonuclease/phosphatase family metal-dependent hydrolase